MGLPGQRQEDLWNIAAERACERLLYEYCRRVDFGEAARIADLFTADGVWSGVELTLTGREEIRAWFERRQALERRVARHVCTNVMVTLDGRDRAHCLSYLVNYRHDRRDGDPAGFPPSEVPKFVGECRDELRRTPEGWRFARRHVDVAFARARREVADGM